MCRVQPGHGRTVAGSRRGNMRFLRSEQGCCTLLKLNQARFRLRRSYCKLYRCQPATGKWRSQGVDGVVLEHPNGHH
jgi:hypothetical protein